MSQFEFVLIFVSIVVAFAVSDILASWGEQIRLRRKVNHFYLHTAWSVLLLFVMMQVWWSLWSLSDQTSWTFPGYLALSLPFLTLALMAYILTPNMDESHCDVRQHYFEICRWFFSLAAFYLVSWAFYTHGVEGNSLATPGSGYRFAGIALMSALAVWSDERFHSLAAVVAYLLMTAWLWTVVL